MASILDNNALDDFIDSAEMEGNQFEVKRVHQNHSFLLEPTVHRSIQTLNYSEFTHEQLSIPRKPKWNRNMTAEEVDRNEKNAFLRWRREIAAIESDNNYTKKVTPFEKNLEVWRQLWRVCERSDLMIQIVDARNPLLYYTKDLMSYVSNMDTPKPMILLINKADFLTEIQRIAWARHFTALGVRFAFYSAQIEQFKLDAVDAENAQDPEEACASVVNRADIELLATSLVSGWCVTKADAALSNKVEDTAVCSIPSPDEKIADGKSVVEEEEVSDSDSEIEAASEDEGESNVPSARSEKNTNNNNNRNGNTLLGIVDAAGSDDEEEDTEDSLIRYLEKVRLGKQQQESISCNNTNDDSEEENEDGNNNEEEEIVSRSKQVEIKASKGVATAVVPLNAEQRQARVLSRGELMLLLNCLSQRLGLVGQMKHDGRVCVGLVGYPNVGKSSVINSLLGVSKSTHGNNIEIGTIT